MTDTIEGPTESYQYGTWEASVDLRLGRLRMYIVAEGAAVGAALALGILSMRTILNLAKAMNQLAQVTNGIQGAMMQSMGHVQKPVTGLDESPISDGPIAEPAMGPESQVSDKIREQIESDPVKPATVFKADPIHRGPMDYPEGMTPLEP